MADEVFGLTADDVRVIKDVVRDSATRRRNPGLRGGWDDEGHQAPETYLARTPAGGIRPIIIDDETGTGTQFGTGSFFGTGTGAYPGYADCTICRVGFVGPEDLPKLEVLDFDRRVYNHTDEIIPANSWILITRDKAGHWYVAGNAGGLAVTEVTVVLDVRCGSGTVGLIVTKGRIRVPSTSVS